MRNKNIVLSNLQCDINELQICILHAVELQIRQNESSSLRQKKRSNHLICPKYPSLSDILLSYSPQNPLTEFGLFLFLSCQTK